MDQFRFGKYLKINERQGSYVLAFLVLSVLTFGVVYSIILGDELRFLPDESNYLVLAQNLAEKGAYSLPFYSWFIDPCLDAAHTEMPTAFRAPGYPLALSVVFWLGGNIVHARILNFLFLAGTMIFVYLLLREKRTALAGLIGAAGVIAYPVLIFTAGAFYPQTFAGFLFAAVLFLLMKSPAAPVHAGLVLGSLVLTVPQFLFTAPIFAVWLWWARKESFLRIAQFGVGVLLVVGIWTARNAVVFDSFIPVATNAGYNLLLGNSENTVVNAETTTNICVHWPDPSLTEVEQDAHFRNAALQFIRENPGSAFKLYIQKWANYFNFRNRLVTNTESTDGRDLLVLFTYGPLLLIAIGRVFFMKHKPLSKDEILFYVIYLGSAFVMAVFFSRIRFRLPFDLILILIAAMQSYYLIHKYLVKTK